MIKTASRNIGFPAPFVAWTNPNAPKVSDKAPALSIISAPQDSSPPLSTAHKIADWMRSEFDRRTDNGSYSKGTSVTLEYIPTDLQLESACAIMRGMGFRAEAHRQEPMHQDDEAVMAVWLEKNS